MKKIILLIVVAVLSFTNLTAQSLAGYKICINPGHGGHDSNDREIPLGNGVTFWESEGNLSKGLYLKSILESLGATVYMSRTTNLTSDDLPLSQISALANSNNVDYFHSIHSNAFNAASNYTLILFNGYDQTPKYPESKVMGTIIYNKIKEANRTLGNTNVRGDYNFYGWKDNNGNPTGLGVLNGLTMPGTLSEGSFHDYTPESWRLKNESYLKHEAWAIARGFLQYFNGGSFQNGIVAGILRNELDIVPTTYNPINGTKDSFKPVNGTIIKLEPGGKTYTTDNFNNGYYFFDELAPGTYKLIIPDDMKTDTVSVVVKANESVFADKFLVKNPIFDLPVITNFSPANNITEASNVSNIVFEFSVNMNTDITQNAITISPSVAGSFKWEPKYKKLAFTPTRGYVQGTKYTVTISPSAKTYFGVNLQQQSSFSFTTRSQFNLVSTYPATNAADISTTVVMRLQFDKGIDGTTMANKILVVDSTGVAVQLQANTTRYSLGIIDFEPKTPLNNNAAYTITVKEGIGDVEYVTFPKTVTIGFKTEQHSTYTGTVLEGFETANIWQSLLLSPNTKGINTSLTSFAISNSKKISGNYSGRLDYAFSSQDGAIELALLNPIALGESSSEEFGLWVFGDASNNILEYRFTRQNSTEEKVKIDTINWTGWKLKKISLNTISGSGSIQFKSLNVLQSAAGSLSGRLFFDECIANIITGVQAENNLPREFSLEQNYPNPFNPATTIKFSIPSVNTGKAVSTILKIYDLLGREITTLVNEDKAPGDYLVTFNANGLASGIYLYRIQAGNYNATKKLLLLK